MNLEEVAANLELAQHEVPLEKSEGLGKNLGSKNEFRQKYDQFRKCA